MTVLRGAWTVFLPRRQEGLSKMMACSVFFHLFLFLSIVLNGFLFSAQKTSFDGFQVNLVASGGGGGITSGPVNTPGASKKSKKSSSKKSSKVSVKAPPVAKKSSPKQTAPKVSQAKAKVAPKPLPALTRAPRRSVNAPPPETDDPERLQEWWKKQKKALKAPSVTPGIKPKMGTSERTRTAKIDIQKRSKIVPPVVSPPKPAPQVIPIPDKAELGKQADLEASSNPLESSPLEENGAEESVGQEEGSVSQGQGDDEASLQASLGPGITGIGPGGGGASFRFPNYLQKVDHKIRWRWAPPPVASTGDRLVIRFVIQKSGSIDKSTVEIAESSGNLFFDQAAMRAIYAAHPLPPLPKAYHEDVLIVFMNFVVREDS